MNKKWILGAASASLMLSLVACAGFAPANGGPNGGTATAPLTGQVTSLTAISAVESSGTVEAQQTASVAWEITGLVAAVNVQPGDIVTKGAPLMTIDISSAGQSVIQAQADLISAQNALEDLLNPTALSLAQAEQKVADAYDALSKAERELRGLQSPDVTYYEDQVANAELALENAQRSTEITNLGEAQTAVTNAQEALDNARTKLQDLKNQEARYPGCCSGKISDQEEVVAQAENNLAVAKLRLEQAQTNNATSVEDAQENLNDAQANLAAAQRAPDAIKLAQVQAKVAVAQANLAEAEQTLADLQTGPDPDDVKVAEIRVQIAQNTLSKLTLYAPIAGEVLEVNYLPGDRASQTEAAVVIADRSTVHINAAVDESEIGQIKAGNPVTLTFDALPDLTLTGVVARIEPLGETVQGIVRYTVRIEATQTDPRVLLGMTANATIITNVQEGALAVPLEAVQYDDQGEYVTRQNLAGLTERVDIVTGEVIGDLIVVTGKLNVGDTVVIIPLLPTPFSPFVGPGN